MKKILICLVVCSLSFSQIPFSQAQTQTLRINEIGAFESSAHEWIEISNVSNVAIDMSDYIFFENNVNHSISLFNGEDMTIDPGEFGIICNKAEDFLAKYPEMKLHTILDSSWSSLSTSGETIALKQHDVIIDSISFGESSTGSLQRINEKWVEAEPTLGMTNALSEKKTTYADGIIFVENHIFPPELISPGTAPVSMVLVLTQMQNTESNQHNPYSYMLYYLEDYKDTNSLTTYLDSLSSSIQNPETQIPEEPEETTKKQEQTENSPIEETIPEKKEPDELEQMCLAWWEERMSVTD